MAPHERSFVAPGGDIQFVVGAREEFISRLPPLNQMGTTREALVSVVGYGKADGAAAGKLRVGYHVGCAATIGPLTLGATPHLLLGLGAGPSVDPAPTIALNLNPGEVKEVPIVDKDIVPGKLTQLSVRDFHIVVNSCSGPVSIREYTYADVKSAEVDDSGAVFGDPTWL
ncbi:MspA family porin [Nocardia panacis]|nr:MspA family porin [Nocardia panacis]